MICVFKNLPYHSCDKRMQVPAEVHKETLHRPPEKSVPFDCSAKDIIKYH